MRLATILSLGASALLGVAALVGARLLLPSGEDKAQPAQRTVPVVAAARDIPYGTTLEAGALTLVQLPADAAPAGAFSSIDQALKADAGKPPTALMAIAAKETLLPAKLTGGSARASLAAMISPGMRAYTIKSTDVSGVGGHALPGDHVDVLLAREPKSAGGPVLVDVVLQNARVLGVNLNADPASEEKTPPKTTTLEVAVQDAERLSVAGKVGTMSLALRRTGGVDVETIHPIATAGMRIGGGVDPAAAPKARPAVRRAPPRPAARSGGLVIVNGAERSVVGAGA